MIDELKELESLLDRYNALTPKELERLEALAEENERCLREIAPEFFEVLNLLADE